MPRSAGQFDFNSVKKSIHVGDGITASSNRWLTENGVADLLKSKRVSRLLLQRCLHAAEKSINLAGVITAFTKSGLRESHVADIFCSETRTLNCFGLPMLGLCRPPLLSQLTFEVGDALVGVVVVHQQMIPPTSGGLLAIA